MYSSMCLGNSRGLKDLLLRELPKHIDNVLINVFGQLPEKQILEPPGMGHSGFQSLKGNFSGNTHSHNSNEIFRARPFIAFLYTTVKERPDFCPTAYIETPHPHRPIKGIRGKAEQVDTQLLYINGYLAQGIAF